MQRLKNRQFIIDIEMIENISEMVKILARFPDSVIPLIKELLKPIEQDDCWKFSVIIDLIPAFSAESQELLAESIRRIIDSPTDGEMDCGVSEVASNYLLNRQQR